MSRSDPAPDRAPPDGSKPDRSNTVAQLRQQLRQLEGLRRPAGAERYSTGCPALDQLLPEGGLTRGTLVEWLAAGESSGAGSLALAAAREICRQDGPLVVVDGQSKFYPPAAALAGLDLDRLILVKTPLARDETWALDQALRSAGVGAVLCWAERLSQRSARRLQLAAETGAGLGLLIRPEAARQEPCWAGVRLLVQPLTAPVGRRLRVELLRAPGAAPGGSVELELDDETGALRLAPSLVRAAPARRRSGA